MRKSLEWNGGNKTERKIHRRYLLHTTHEHGMAAAGSYLLCQLREIELHNGQKNNFIEKGSEKKLGLGAGT